MKRSLLTVLAIVSACTTPALADEFEGAASIGASYSNIHGQQAKFNEYRILGDGAQGSLDLNYRADSGYYLEGSTDFSIIDSSEANDVNLNIKTGLQDVFKGSIFYNEIPHNMTLGAKTFQTGVGGNTLTSTAGAKTNADFINNIDYGIKRNNYGVEAEISLRSPFFFLTRVERNESNGLLPMTVRVGTGAGAALEVPAPISYRTDTLFLQAGYRSNHFTGTLDGTMSNFNNDNQTFRSYNPTINATQTAYLPQNNQYYKLGSSVMYKIPFFSSTLMARASHSYLDSDFTFFESIPAGRTSWDGKVQETSASFAITSTPTSKLNSRIYYSYFDRSNDSDKGFTYGTGLVKTFRYHKNNAGLDVNYKLPANTKVATGYEYSVTDRELTYRTNTNSSFSSSPETVDHRFYAQAKNDLFDWMSARIKVQRLIRQSDFDYRNTAASAGITVNTNRYGFRPFGVADKIQDTIKTGLDFNLFENMDFGVEYAYTNNNYNHTTMGVEDANTHGINIDTNYTKGIAKINAYADIEFSKTNGIYTNGTYTYTSTRKDTNYALGAKTDFEIIKDVLSAGAGYRYERADGSNDFTRDDATSFANIDAIDDYIKNSVNAKMSYKFNKNLTVDFGYIYESLNYSDDAYANYNYVSGYTSAGPGGTSLLYQTGAYADPDYTANVFYTKLNFKF